MGRLSALPLRHCRYLDQPVWSTCGQLDIVTLLVLLFLPLMYDDARLLHCYFWLLTSFPPSHWCTWASTLQ